MQNNIDFINTCYGGYVIRCSIASWSVPRNYYQI